MFIESLVLTACLYKTGCGETETAYRGYNPKLFDNIDDYGQKFQHMAEKTLGPDTTITTEVVGGCIILRKYDLNLMRNTYLRLEYGDRYFVGVRYSF